ncbi:hypothetical protein FM737_001065 [Escherichia marmotae]|nr:hypothetical protein FM737_001065 [Escherichia marmotae]
MLPAFMFLKCIILITCILYLVPFIAFEAGLKELSFS